MGRWSYLDTDEERLPEGMTRIGYDADSQTYTYRDADGSIWEGASGNRYGQLWKVKAAARPRAATAPVSDNRSPDEKPLPRLPDEHFTAAHGALPDDAFDFLMGWKKDTDEAKDREGEKEFEARPDISLRDKVRRSISQSLASYVYKLFHSK